MTKTSSYSVPKVTHSLIASLRNNKSVTAGTVVPKNQHKAGNPLKKQKNLSNGVIFLANGLQQLHGPILRRVNGFELLFYVEM